MVLKHLLTGAAVVALLGPPSLAQDAQQPQLQADQAQVAQEDIDFAKEAAQGGLIEVRLGELAQQQAKSSEVKDFGQRMVEDHGQANDKLMQIAQQKDIELPQTVSDDAQETYDELKEQSGAEFDEAYMDEMVSDHEDDVAAFEDYLGQAKDPDLRSFAEETLPTLREHLELARQTQEHVTAEDSGDEQPDPAMAANQPTEGEPGWVSIEEVLGSAVLNEDGEEVGEIQDLVAKDDAYYAVVSVGGFLGIGEKDVAIPLDELKLGEDESYLMSTKTEDQLEEMPAYDQTQYQPYASR